MNTRKFLLAISAATLTLTMVMPAPSNAADQTTVQEVIEKGPAQVVDSWMEPKIVRTREVKDSDGNTTVINEPLIQERHEQVIVPTNKSTVTTTIHQEPAVIKTEKRVISQVPVKRSVKKKRVYKPRKVAYKPKPKKHTYVAARQVVREEVKPATTTVIQQTEQSSVEESYERRHPALEIIH